MKVQIDEAELIELRADRWRLEWMIKMLNEVGTTGFGSVVRWGYPGLSREDIDAAIYTSTKVDIQEAEDTAAEN